MRKSKKSKILLATGLLLAGAGVVAGLHAYPAPGPGQETYVVYYSDAARTQEVGTRAIAHDSTCSVWHITWGRTTSYSRVFVSRCDFAEF